MIKTDAPASRCTLVTAAGGYRGKPFRLVPSWSESPWAGGVNRVARMVYEDNVFAILANSFAVPGATVNAAIDAIVVQLASFRR